MAETIFDEHQAGSENTGLQPMAGHLIQRTNQIAV